ncbi:MAG: TetR/AcrR family transcriptional regulator [Bacteroidota bacterium]|nr:TetR/AcrR family transcriptional regulator [Bacteroidota bacterium]
MEKEKHNKIRQSLLKSAEQLFARFGFEKTTMNDIANEARKGKSSLYYYFSSKEEIFKAVVTTEAEQFKDIITETLENIDDPKEQIKQYFSIRMHRFQELSNLYAVMRNDYLRKLDFIEKARKQYDQEELEFIQNILKKGVNKGEFEIQNITKTSFALASTIKGLEFPLVLQTEKQDLDHRIDALLSILFYGIVKR